MNVGTLTISLTARTAALLSSLSKVRTFESGVMASVQRMNRSVGTLGQSLSVLSLPLIAIGALAVTSFAKFEFAMAKTVGLAGVASEKVQAWTKDVFALSRATGETAMDLGEALYFTASSGIHGAKVLEVLEVSAYGAMVGLGKVKDIANLLTSVMNAYGIENVSVAGTMDTLIAAVREGKAEADDMARSLGMVVSVASELDISFANVAAAVAATTRTGVPVTTSVTQLRQLLFMFLKERPMVEDALHSMGLSFEEVRKNLSEDLLGGLIKLRAVTSAWGDQAVAKVLPNVRAFNEALALTGVNVFETIKLFKAIQVPTNAFEDAIKAAHDTVHVKFRRMLADLNIGLMSFGSSIADDIMPIVQKFAELISKLLGWFTSLDDSTQSITVTIVALSAVLGPALLVFSSLVTMVGNLAGALLSPIGLVLAFAAALLLAYRNGDLFSKWVEQMIAGGSVAEKLEKNKKIVQTYADGMLKTFEMLNTKINEIEKDNPNLINTDYYKKTIADLEQARKTLENAQNNFNSSGIEEQKANYKSMLILIDNVSKAQKEMFGSADLLLGTTSAEDLQKTIDAVNKVQKESLNLQMELPFAEETVTAFDIVKAEGSKFMDWAGSFVSDFNKKLNSGGGVKLNLGVGSDLTLDNILKYKDAMKSYEDRIYGINEALLKYGNAEKAFGKIPGLSDSQSLQEMAKVLGTYVDDLSTEINNLMGTNQIDKLVDTLSAIPEGLMSIIDPEQMKTVNDYIVTYNKSLDDANKKLALMRELQPRLNLSEANTKTKSSYLPGGSTGTIFDLPGEGSSSIFDANMEYWQSMKANAKAAIDEIRAAADIETPGSGILAPIPDSILAQYKEAVDTLNAMNNVKFNTTMEIANSVHSLANQFYTLGDAIKSTFEDGKVTFSEFLNIVSAGLSLIQGVQAVSIFMKNLDTMATKKNTQEEIKNTIAKSVNATVTMASVPAANALAAAQNMLAIANGNVAVTGAAASTSWIPIVGVGLAIAGVIAMVAAMSNAKNKVANLADGGIIPRGYPNDTFPANLSSNEAVIPLDRLPQMMGLQSGKGSKKVEFVIEGRVLKAILEDAEMMGGLK